MCEAWLWLKLSIFPTSKVEEDYDDGNYIKMKDTLKIDDDHGIGIKIVIAKVPFIAIIKKVEQML